MRALELTGKRFTRLLVVDSVVRSKNASGKKKRNWLCHCDCGTWRILPTERLTCSNTLSCGCLRKEGCSQIGKIITHKTAPGEAGFNDLLRKYKQGARARQLPFELTKEAFRSLTQKSCHYCGTEPSRIHAVGKAETKRRGAYTCNGVDRLDSKGGYTTDNCVTACTECNMAKQTLSHDQFLSLVSRIFEHKIKGIK